MMAFNVVLVHPEIPTNTGNIGRLCLASGSQLHLVKPLGFEISDSRLKRAGLDYWPLLDVAVYENFDDLLEKHPGAGMHFFSAHAEKAYTAVEFRKNDFLVFGRESDGLPEKIIRAYAEKCYRIPLRHQKVRSLNLANAVAIAVYEGLRQLDCGSG